MARAAAAGRLESLRRLKVHRHAVDAVAQMRGRRAVLEDMAEMAAAAAAMHLGADHPVALVHRRLGRALDRIVEARPAGAAFEFLVGHEQRLGAARADERAGALLVVERATAGRLGPMRAHYPVLLRGEELVPLFVGAGERECLAFHGPTSFWLSFYTCSSTISGRMPCPDTATRATVTGSLNRRGPALPGLRNNTPSRVSIEGWCEWPKTTAAKPACAGSRSSCEISCSTKNSRSPASTSSHMGRSAAQSP